MLNLSIEERLKRKLVQAGHCLEYVGKRNLKGYGIFSVTRDWSRREFRAHRLAYEIWVGPIPEGKLVCHSCDNPACCNPDHLFLGSPLDNMRDMIEKGRARHGAGEENGRCKLTDAQVAEIRARYVKRSKPGQGTSSEELSTEFGIARAYVTALCRGVTRSSE